MHSNEIQRSGSDSGSQGVAATCRSRSHACVEGFVRGAKRGGKWTAIIMGAFLVVSCLGVPPLHYFYLRYIERVDEVRFHVNLMDLGLCAPVLMAYSLGGALLVGFIVAINAGIRYRGREHDISNGGTPVNLCESQELSVVQAGLWGVTMPRRSPLRWFYLANSGLVIGGCVLIVSWGLGAILTMPRSFRLIFAFPVLFAIVVGLVQYAAAFRRRPGAARALAVLFFIASALATCLLTVYSYLVLPDTLGLLAIANLVELGGPNVRAFLVMLAIAYAVNGYGYFCGWINLRWSRCLCERLGSLDSGMTPAEKPKLIGPRRFQFSLRELFLCMIVVAVISGLAAWSVRCVQQPPMYIPEQATDVVQGRSFFPVCLACEFTIDEPGFLAWMQSDHLPRLLRRSLRPIDSNHFANEIPCSGFMRDPPVGPPTVVITNGYYADWWDDGRPIQIAYDRDKQRAYYYRGPELGTY